MADLKFQLDMDRTAVLELKLGTYIRGDRGPVGAQGETGPAGELTDQDQATLQNAIDASAASAAAALQSQGAAAGSANAASASAGSANSAAVGAGASATQSAQSAAAAAGSATQAAAAQNDVAGNANAAAASAAAAHTSETNAATSQGAAAGSASAAAASQTAAKTSETNSAASAAAAASSAASVNNGRVLIQTQGPTNVANVFANLTDYDVYELVFDGLLPTNNLQDIGMHFSTDNGATWLTTAQYRYNYALTNNTTTGAPVGAGFSAVNNLTLWGQATNVTGSPFYATYEGIIKFFNFRRPAVAPSALFDMSGVGSGSQAFGRLSGSGQYLALTGQPINAFRIFCGSAGFSRGALSLYGYKR